MSEWKLVPVEPDAAMRRAAVVSVNGNAVYKSVAAKALEIEEQIYAEVYSAMLAASPPAPSAEPVDWESIALAAAQEIALMWGQDRSQFVSKIQMRVLDAMLAVLDPPAPSAAPTDHTAAMRMALDALNDMNNGWQYIRASHGDLYGVGWDRAENKASAAIDALRKALGAK